MGIIELGDSVSCGYIPSDWDEYIVTLDVSGFDGIICFGQPFDSKLTYGIGCGGAAVDRKGSCVMVCDVACCSGTICGDDIGADDDDPWDNMTFAKSSIGAEIIHKI